MLVLSVQLPDSSIAYPWFIAIAARGAGTLIPSAQRLVWAAKQALGNAALGALFA